MTDKKSFDDKADDSRNFSDKWLNNVFEILMRLEDYERLAKNGCVTLLEYVQNQELDLTLIQNKNFNLFMTEIEILLNDIKYFVDKKDFLILLLKFDRIKKIEDNIGGFIEVRLDMVAHNSENILKPEFYRVIPLMSDLRGLVVKILFTFIDPKFKRDKEEL